MVSGKVKLICNVIKDMLNSRYIYNKQITAKTKCFVQIRIHSLQNFAKLTGSAVLTRLVFQSFATRE